MLKYFSTVFQVLVLGPLLFFIYTDDLSDNLSYKKPLGLFPDSESDFKEHLTNVCNTVSKIIGVLRKPQKSLPRPPLIKLRKFL